MPRLSSPGIFLSYRRDDAPAYVRLLQVQLRERFPDAPVFMDLDSIEPGLDFDKVIRAAIDSCAVLVALIGRQWATLTDEDGQRRLDNPDDYVRFEIQTALRRGVRVIPVLVDGARPLQEQQLPSELRGLARLNALDLSFDRYQYDANRLVDLIERVLTAASGTGTVHQSSRRNRPGNLAWLIVEAERIAQTIIDELWKNLPLVNVATALASTDPDGAERIARSFTDDGYSVSALVNIAKALATTDPERAARLIDEAERIARSIPEEDISFDSARVDIATALAATDPDRAEQIAQSTWDDFSKASMLAVIATVRAATDLGHVAVSSAALDNITAYDSALADIAKGLAATDPDRAERIVRSITKDSSRVRALAVLSSALAATDPDRAARLIADAERAARSITKDSLRVSALAVLAKGLAAIDRDRVARLIADAERIAQPITSENSKAMALADIAGALAVINPNRALRMAQSITHELSRVRALARIAKAIAATDPDRAARLIADAERIAQPITHGWSDVALAGIVDALVAADSDLG